MNDVDGDDVKRTLTAMTPFIGDAKVGRTIDSSRQYVKDMSDSLRILPSFFSSPNFFS
jgi:hypothetical protein